jgi:hypothetical protein
LRFDFHYKVCVKQITEGRSALRLNFYGGAFSNKLASCHPYGALIFEAAYRFFFLICAALLKTFGAILRLTTLPI